jgi:hypothetical protein
MCVDDKDHRDRRMEDNKRMMSVAEIASSRNVYSDVEVKASEWKYIEVELATFSYVTRTRAKCCTKCNEEVG